MAEVCAGCNKPFLRGVGLLVTMHESLPVGKIALMKADEVPWKTYHLGCVGDDVEKAPAMGSWLDSAREALERPR